MAERHLVQSDVLIDGSGAPPLSEGAVLIEGEHIVDVAPASEFRRRKLPTTRVRGTLLPGLIDCHTHLVLSGVTDPRQVLLSESRTTTVARAVNHLRQALRRGVTSIRDLGGLDGIDLDLSRAVAAGLIPGPRVFPSGTVICITGGHACWIGYEVDSADEARKAAREQIKRGAYQIKLIATGGVMTPGVEPGAPQMTPEELEAACSEAHKSGRRVASHAQGTTGIINALEAGVDSIEHGFYIDQRAIELFKARGAFLIPTFSAAEAIATGAERGVPEWMVTKTLKVIDAHTASFRRALKAGVRIACGTDAGTPLNPHGNVANEIKAMARRGMPAMAAIQAATGWAAECLGRDDIGLLAKGRYADLIVVDGNPLEDLSALERVQLVYKGGAPVTLGA